MEWQELIKARVARGLAWIKANAERLSLNLLRVDLDTVNVHDEYTCVLAQSGNRMFQEVLDDAGNPDHADMLWITDHGFASPWTWVPATARANDAALADEWRRVLRAERETAVTAP